MNSNNIGTKLFQRFMNAYGSISAKVDCIGSTSQVSEADTVIVLGMRVATDSPKFYDALKSTSNKDSSKVVYAHPIEDVAMLEIATQFIKYEPGSEEGVLALLAYHLLKDVELPENKRSFLNDLDLAYLEAESNTGEEEFEEIINSLDKSNKNVLLVGDDLISHDRAENIAKICAMIEKYSTFSLIFVSAYEKKVEELKSSEANGKLEEVEELPEYNGTVIYNSNIAENSEAFLHGSAQFATAARISDGDFISISFGGQTVNRKFKMDSELKGTIAINPTFDITVETDRYKFERSKINKINQKSESR